MQQFQNSLGPIQDLQPAGQPRPAERLKNGSPAASGGVDCTACANGEGDYFVERLKGWRLIGAIVVAVAVSWVVVYLVGAALYATIVWLA